MIGGTITASATGVGFVNSKSTENKLENVIISTGKDKNSGNGIRLEKESRLTLKNVKVTQTGNSVIANNRSNITISGGSFDSSYATICAQNGSSITLTDNAQITSYDEAGLYAKDSKSIVTVTGGTVQGKTTALSAQNGGRIKATNVTLITADSNGSGAESQDVGSLVELYGDTTIKNAEIGLSSENDGMIKMIGGTVIAENSAFVVNNNGHIDVTDVSATAEDRAIAFEKSKNNKTSEINLTNTKLHIKNGTGINANESIGKVNLKNSEIRANVLLVTEASTKKNDFTFTLNADHSILDGKVSTEKKIQNNL
ncbi:Uncharacterised protein [Bartonella grahamii]|uniref:Uncharacterized protein n=2 Tax=Bartonella grahamii TaxID=33045 RepID=A0A336NP99_BARGR|nr:hypothetical protein [Bartonella grahamii]SSZ40739.1 Uncharacterised protein [Bartonella grahamii]